MTIQELADKIVRETENIDDPREAIAAILREALAPVEGDNAVILDALNYQRDAALDSWTKQGFRKVAERFRLRSLAEAEMREALEMLYSETADYIHLLGSVRQKESSKSAARALGRKV